MSNGFRFVLNKKGVGELLKSDEMADALISHAGKVATKAGTGYEVKRMGTRVIVLARSEEAEQDNYENNTLLKSMG